MDRDSQPGRAPSQAAPVPRHLRSNATWRRSIAVADAQQTRHLEKVDAWTGGFQIALWIAFLLAGALTAANSGHPEAWFGLALIVTTVGYFAARWMRLAVPRWLAVTLIVGTLGAGLCLALLA